IPTESYFGTHYQGDIMDIINDGWDIMIAHPPCTYLAVSGSSWYYHPDDKHLPKEQKRPHPLYPNRRKDQELAKEFFMDLINANIPKIAVENPIGVMSTHYRKPDQIVHPYMFGQEASKPTCLWLKNLPNLIPTNIVGKGEFKTSKSGKRGAVWNWWLPPGPERAKIRSKTFQGIADAMAEQWG
ncbi:MAG: hypothetical protein KKB59_19075, partial [Spirochaetes bacterium]|nr:hypothetical protein [Spirochaetota bacterium]